MSILVLGATGATGRLLVKQLLEEEFHVRIVVRSTTNLPTSISEHPNIKIIIASVLEIPPQQLQEYVSGCTSVVSCLGHNLTFKGLFGAPRDLVTSATKKVCDAIIKNEANHKTKFILMNTTGNANRDIQEQTPLSQRIVVFILRYLLPPHSDNEKASDILRISIGKNNQYIEWAVVRPDGLIDESNVTDYDEHKSPIRNAIFNSGKTSRINVAHFMFKLIHKQDLWYHWKGQMPVIYNKVQS